jgi:hypothetical protein
LGSHLTLTGIAIQLGSFLVISAAKSSTDPVLPVVLLSYATLAAEFLLRFNSDRPVRSIREKGGSLPRGTIGSLMKRMLIGMTIMIILLLIRSTYRIVQLSGGFNGKVIKIQWLFGPSPCRLPPFFSYGDADFKNRRV